MVEQRSAEWFQQRVGLITGSKVGAILGKCKFNKPDDIMRSMVREYFGAESEFNGNVATKHGVACEPLAVQSFEIEMGLDVEEVGFFINDKFPWCGASPDGFTSDGCLLEIKCPYGKKDTGDFVSYIEQPHYYAQMQMQMLATKKKRCYFYQWSFVGTKCEIVDLNREWIKENLPKLKEFHEKYLKEIENKDSPHLMPLVKDKEAKSLAKKYEIAKKNYESAKELLDNVKKELIVKADGEKSNVSGVLVYPIQRKGTINYKKAIKENAPDLDLESYRGEPSESWGVK